MEIKEYITNMKKLSKINESVWSDIRDRANGESVKKEDNIEHFTTYELFSYVCDRYISTSKDNYPIEHSDLSEEYLSIPLFQNKISGLYYRIRIKIENSGEKSVVLCANEKQCPDFINELKNKFDVTIKTFIHIKTKSGEVNNKLFIDVIDTVIENADIPYLKRREN